MIATSFQSDLRTRHQCPVCDGVLPWRPGFLPGDVPCPDCGAYLWCSKRVQDGTVVLEVLPGRTPKPEDIAQLVRSLRRTSQIRHVVADLSALDFANSSFIASLIGLHRQVQAAGGRLVVSDVTPLVREELHLLRLDTLLEIAD